MDGEWIDLGSAEELAGAPLRTLTAGRTRVALVFKDGVGYDPRKLVDAAKGTVGLR